MENQWLTWAKKLQAIASTGMHFGESDFDKERYAEVTVIADQMLAQLGNVPVGQIENLITDYAQGYSTPKVDVRGAVISRGKILLVKEKLDGKWTLPGGYADIGLTPAANIAKEIREEANIKVEIQRLFGVFHKAAHEYDADIRDFYKLFFLCEQIDAVAPTPGSETLDARFFDPHDLPPLSRGRVIEKHIHLAFSFYNNPDLRTVFD